VGRCRIAHGAGADALDTVGDHRLALLEAGQDHRRLGRGLAQRDATLLGLVAGGDHVDIIALLIRQDGRTRDAQRLDRLRALDSDGDELAIGQFPVPRRAGLCAGAHRIGHGGAQRDGIGVGGDRGLDIVELADMVVGPAIWQPQPDHHGGESAIIGVAGA
jgi:hypothetical protein